MEYEKTNPQDSDPKSSNGTPSSKDVDTATPSRSLFGYIKAWASGFASKGLSQASDQQPSESGALQIRSSSKSPQYVILPDSWGGDMLMPINGIRLNQSSSRSATSSCTTRQPTVQTPGMRETSSDRLSRGGTRGKSPRADTDDPIREK